MDVVFVTGCSRSGTTALVDVLNAHHAIVIGMERYKYLYPRAQPDGLRGLFEIERFFDFRPTDTNVRPRGRNRWHALYEEAREKLTTGSAVLIGDKPKAAPSIVAKLTQAYPDARWIHIFRDLSYVAASFEARANDPHDHWPLRAGYRDAHRQWTEGFRAADLLCRRVPRSRLYHMAYDEFFSNDDRQLASLRAFLGVPPSEVQQQYYREVTQDWESRAARPPRLFPAALEWLEGARSDGAEDRFRQLAQRDHEAWLPAGTSP